MEISSDKVLSKMELLIKQARVAKSTEEMKRYISSIQTLCELLVETDFVQEVREVPHLIHQEKTRLQQQPPESVTGNIVKIDGANGTSLLDF